MTFDVPSHDIKPKKKEEDGAQKNVATTMVPRIVRKKQVHI